MTKPLINDVKRSELANVLAIHDFANSSYDLKGWVVYIGELFRRYDLEPTRMGISAPSIKRGKMKTYIREVKKLDTIDNTTITGIEIQATMHGSDDSCWDDIFTAIFSTGLKPEITTCTLVLDSAIVPLNSHIWNQITQQMADFFQPRYGYGFQRSFKKGPEWYPFGVIGDLKYGDPECKLINCWSNTYHKGKYQTGDLRDIYPLNVLSAAHNERMVEGNPLFDWIKADANNGMLTKLADNLWSWRVEESQIDTVRAALKPTGILLCAP